MNLYSLKFVVVVQLLSHVQLFATPWTGLHQATLSFTISQSLLRFMSTELVMSLNHLILCHPLLLLTSIFPSIRVFPNESAFCPGLIPVLLVRSHFHRRPWPLAHSFKVEKHGFPTPCSSLGWEAQATEIIFMLPDRKLRLPELL